MRGRLLPRAITVFRVSAYYPQKAGAHFDFDYYTSSHLELFRKLFGPAGVETITIEHGVPGPANSPAPFVAVGNFTFRDAAKFQDLFAANAPEILADIPKYTNIEPALQFGETVLAK